MATTLTYLDAYCERAGDPALFAEPLNAVTNLFFILAAILAARAICKLAGKHTDLWLLAAVLFAIGIGSGLWHMIPTSSTVLMDVIPITLFIHIYLVSSLRRLLELRWGWVFFWWAVYLGFSIIAQLTLPPDLFNGTIMYIPTYLTLAVLAVAVHRKHPASGRIFFQMLGLWTISLIFRTVDHAVCAQFSLGTHFLWHTLNAIMLFRLLMVLVHHQRGRTLIG